MPCYFKILSKGLYNYFLHNCYVSAFIKLVDVLENTSIYMDMHSIFFILLRGSDSTSLISIYLLI